ncbi:MAG: hypothetical protein ABI559_06930 [Chloroflexota bacterium]
MASAKNAVLAGEGHGTITSADDIKVVKGNYSLYQIGDWYNNIGYNALSVPGAVSSGLDLANDRMRFGAETDEATDGIRAYMRSYCIPDDAYVIEPEQASVPI